MRGAAVDMAATIFAFNKFERHTVQRVLFISLLTQRKSNDDSKRYSSQDINQLARVPILSLSDEIQLADKILAAPVESILPFGDRLLLYQRDFTASSVGARNMFAAVSARSRLAADRSWTGAFIIMMGLLLDPILPLSSDGVILTVANNQSQGRCS